MRIIEWLPNQIHITLSWRDLWRLVMDGYVGMGCEVCRGATPSHKYIHIRLHKDLKARKGNTHG